MKNFFKPCKEEGFTLITVLLILVLLFIYVVSLMSISQNVLSLTSHERDLVMSSSAAETGLAMAIYEINKDTYWPGSSASPDANWGGGFTSWMTFNSGDTRYSVKVFNNYNGDGDRNTDSGDRVPPGSIQLVSSGKTTRGSAGVMTIKTFLKPNAKIPAIIAKGTVELGGSIFSRGIESIYTLTTTPSSDICAQGDIVYSTSNPSSEFIIDGTVSSDTMVNISSISSVNRNRYSGTPLNRSIPDPPVEMYDLPASDVTSLKQAVEDKFPAYEITSTDDILYLDADIINSLDPGNYYVYEKSLEITADSGPLVLDDMNIYVIYGHITAIPEGVTGNGQLVAVGDSPNPLDEMNTSDVPATIKISGLENLDYDTYPHEKLLIYAEGDITLEGNEYILSKNGFPASDPDPLFDDWYETFYEVINDKYDILEGENLDPVSMEIFIQDSSVRSALAAKGVGTELLNNLDSYLTSGGANYSPILASSNCKTIVTHTNHDDENPHSKTALQDMLYSISREYPYALGMYYSKGNINVTGNLHLMGTLIAEGNVTTEDERTTILTPTIFNCLSYSNKLLKDPRFSPHSTVCSSGGEIAMAPPEPTLPALPTSTPSGGGGGGGGGGGCFLEGTLVTTMNGLQKIETLEVGDEIVEYATEDEQFMSAKIKEVLVHEENTDVYYVVKTSRTAVNVTDNHPFYVGDNKYEVLKNLKEGDFIYINTDNKLLKDEILAIEKVKLDKKITVYNLTIEEGSSHNYFANGILVHNLKAAESFATE